MLNDPARQSIGKALGRIPSGVFILTAQHENRRDAMMASWVQQAGFGPPMVSVALAKGRDVAELIRAGKRFALSIIPGDDKALMKHYARLKSGDDPFAGVRTHPAPSGVPILSDALAFLDCRLLHVFDITSDHDIYIAEVTGGELFREGAAFTHQRGNGFHY
jgi:3-hydroxy-9,10-secoandrosta-1,3,5(10)-triene-9,17-dione monooxygenase reductase component